jgi:branched-chain amino acid transport system substrate-binding protein
MKAFKLLLITALVFGAFLSSAHLAVQAQDTIKVGGGFALTGDESALDLPAANGAKLAVKEINDKGGVLGKKIDLVVRDSKYQMDTTAQIAKQFVEEDKVVAVVGFTDSDSVLASGPIIQKAGLPYITAGATSPKLPEQIGDLMFLACFGDNVQAAAGAEFSFKKFGKTAYLLTDKGVEYTTLLSAYFKSRFTQLGGQIVLEDTYEDKATDFTPQITKLKALSKQPDFYYIAAMPYNVGPVVKQLRDAGLTAPVVGGDGYDTPDLVSVAGPAAENTYFTTHALMDAKGSTEGIKKFIDAYTKEYGHEPENAFAALGYDAMYLLADAMTRAKGTDAQAVKKALEETKGFKAITGSITFSADSHVPQKGVTMILVKDGKFTLAQEVIPEKVPNPDLKDEGAATPAATASK